MTRPPYSLVCRQRRQKILTTLKVYWKVGRGGRSYNSIHNCPDLEIPETCCWSEWINKQGASGTRMECYCERKRNASHVTQGHRGHITAQRSHHLEGLCLGSKGMERELLPGQLASVSMWSLVQELTVGLGGSEGGIWTICIVHSLLL